jgi:hypothetical protein
MESSGHWIIAARVTRWLEMSLRHAHLKQASHRHVLREVAVSSLWVMRFGSI